jgi:hypothetical protein
LPARDTSRSCSISRWDGCNSRAKKPSKPAWKHDESAGAIEHLDFVIGEFREMKMQPSLERALRHKDVLKA